MTWPWVLHWRNAVADKGDPYIIAWTLWWDFHQTFHNPLHLFDANIFYPYHYTLAFGEHDYGISVLFFPLFALGFTPLAVHGIATLSGYALSGYGAFRLGRTLTDSVAAACVTGIVFAFCPYHMFKFPHLHYMFTCWIPLTLEALILFSRERSWRRASWLGIAFFMNALTCVSWLLLTIIPFTIAAIILVLRYGIERDRRFWNRSVAAIFIAGLLLLPFLVPYYKVSKTYGFKRTIEDSAVYSANLENWIVVDERNKFWQGLGLGRGIPYNSETALFPGALPIILSLLAIAFALFAVQTKGLSPNPDKDYKPPPKSILGALDLTLIAVAVFAMLIGAGLLTYEDPTIPLMAIVVIAITRCSIAYPAIFRRNGRTNLIATLRTGSCPEGLSIGLLFITLGFAGSLGTNFFFHRFLFRFMPLFDSMRVPARWAMICDLGLAILAGLGAASILKVFLNSQRRALAGIIFAVIVSLILFEQRVAPLNFAEGEADPDKLAIYLKDAPMKGGIAELPTGPAGNDYLYTLRAADHGRPLITASDSFIPPLKTEIVDLTTSGGIPIRLLDLLESIPASYLIIHYELLDSNDRANYERFLAEGLRQHRLFFLRTFDDHGRIDLYAVTKTEPQLAAIEARPPFSLDKTAVPPETENPIDIPAYFVSQLYHDFLGRDPDPGGQRFWTAQITACEGNQDCVAKERTDVAMAFSTEQEFSETGGLVVRLYYAAFGRRPTFQEFVRDRNGIAAVFKSDSGIEKYLKTWQKGPAFKNAYPVSLAGPQFKEQILRNAGLSTDESFDGQSLIGTTSEAERAHILMRVIASEGFKARTRDESFLLMQYFGFLRRDPDDGEIANRLGSLGRADLTARQDMVARFITSPEYRARFAETPTP